MRKWNWIIMWICFLGAVACQKRNTEQIEKWKQEVLDTEKDFAEMVKQQGIHKAFVYFADENAVLMRKDQIIAGKSDIELYYSGQHSRNLDWKPDFVEVAASGDLAYTYGKYTFTSTDSLGNENISTGVFHTVWKKQADGAWRFVWD